MKTTIQETADTKKPVPIVTKLISLLSIPCSSNVRYSG